MQNHLRACIAWFILLLIFNPASSQTENEAASFSDQKQVPFKSANPEALKKFYVRNQENLFWFNQDPHSMPLRQALVSLMDSSREMGLPAPIYYSRRISALANKEFSLADSLRARQADRAFTDAAIRFARDIYLGRNISSWINADFISMKYALQDEEFIVSHLLTCRTSVELIEFFHSLEPDRDSYRQMKAGLLSALESRDTLKIRKLTTSMNLLCWISHFSFQQFIVVNIPSATLGYYESDSLVLAMKVILGKPRTRTPRLAVYCSDIILYPYWNVPHKIAVEEFLPLFKKSAAMVSSMNMQILDASGKMVDEHTLNWGSFNKDNFPYQVRQSTGCDNALGVIKFNLNSPYDVYMHDTNLKSAFSFRHRFLSHGCIRLEKPMELANHLLPLPLDSEYLQACLKDQKPVPIQLEKPVPVFVVYMPVMARESEPLAFFPDVYHLLR